jgi:hypothetical protein
MSITKNTRLDSIIEMHYKGGMYTKPDGKGTILAVSLPKPMHEKLERDKKRTGLSKSHLVRILIQQHYASHGQLKVTANG